MTNHQRSLAGHLYSAACVRIEEIDDIDNVIALMSTTDDITRRLLDRAAELRRLMAQPPLRVVETVTLPDDLLPMFDHSWLPGYDYLINALGTVRKITDRAGNGLRPDWDFPVLAVLQAGDVQYRCIASRDWDRESINDRRDAAPLDITEEGGQG